VRIYKYELPSAGAADIELPAFAQPLSVGWQGSFGDPRLMLWAAIDDRPDLHSYRFHVLTTGSELSSEINARYIGTAQLIGQGGQYVVHVYLEI